MHVCIHYISMYLIIYTYICKTNIYYIHVYTCIYACICTHVDRFMGIYHVYVGIHVCINPYMYKYVYML